MFTGYSALAVALALPDDGRILACDISDEYTRVGRPHWERAGVDHKIELVLGPALARSTRDSPPATPDATTSRSSTPTSPATPHYYERCLQLLRPGGLIAIDNVLWSGRVARPAEPGDADTLALQRAEPHPARRRPHRHRAAADRRRPDAGAQALSTCCGNNGVTKQRRRDTAPIPPLPSIPRSQSPRATPDRMRRLPCCPDNRAGASPATVILVASVVLAVAAGSRSSWGLFIGPINSASGFGPAVVSLAVASSALAWGVAQPLCGALVHASARRACWRPAAFSLPP